MSESDEETISRWQSVNLAQQSLGSIHDDDTARTMGFAGGFVGGVTVLSQVFDAWLSQHPRGGELPLEVQFNLGAPTYAGELVEIRAIETGRQWKFTVHSGADLRQTSTGFVASGESTSPPTEPASGAIEIPQLTHLASAPQRIKRTFETDAIREYYLRTGAEPPSDELLVPLGMWANPMATVIDSLKGTAFLTIHKASAIQIFEHLLPETDYIFSTSLIEVRYDEASNKGYVLVKCDAARPDKPATPSVTLVHKSAVRARQ